MIPIQLRYYILYLFAFLVIVDNGFAQTSEVSGKVTDATTGEALAFVHVLTENSKFGCTTDIDGNFRMKVSPKSENLVFSYIGYEEQLVAISQVNMRLLVKLQPIEIELGEVVVRPGVNPAHRIIDSVLLFRTHNDPKNRKSYAYTAYDKMVLTIDTLQSVAKKNPLPDTTDSKEKMKDFLSERDFFMMETVTEKKFMAPEKSLEKVVATKISGFKDPIFVFLISQIQSTSFYDETIKITSKNYINPISRGSINKYLFILEKTTPTSQGDTIFSISYRPFLKTNFDGLEGVLTINSDGWAIQNVTAKPFRADDQGFSISIQQLYTHLGDSVWFPTQLNTNLILRGAVVDDGQKQFPLIGIGKSYIRDIELDPELLKRQFSAIAIEVEPDASDKDAAFWMQYRIDSLNQRTIETYRFMDSVGKAENFDRIARSFETFVSGRIPMGKIDLNMDKLIRFNDFEGLYLGLGAQTNSKFSKNLLLGGFWGYGFGDKTAKYSLNIKYEIDRFRQFAFDAAYALKAVETGAFFDHDPDGFSLNPDQFRQLYINRMDYIKGYKAGFSIRALQHFKWGIHLQHQEKTATYGYQFQNKGLTPSSVFNFTNIQLSARFMFKEKFMQTSRNLISLGSDFPVIHLNYTHGFDGFLNGEFTFNKLELQSTYSFFIKYLGESSIVLKAGAVSGTIPATELFNAPASYKSIALYARESFTTMRINEFFSDRFLALFFRHNFGKLLVRKGRFEPEFEFATNIGFGRLSARNGDVNINLKSMEKGYFESGLLANNLLRLPGMKFGLGGFYRYGPYRFALIKQNIAIQFSLVFGF